MRENDCLNKLIVLQGMDRLQAFRPTKTLLMTMRNKETPRPDFTPLYFDPGDHREEDIMDVDGQTNRQFRWLQWDWKAPRCRYLPQGELINYRQAVATRLFTVLIVAADYETGECDGLFVIQRNTPWPLPADDWWEFNPREGLYILRAIKQDWKTWACMQPPVTDDTRIGDLQTFQPDIPAYKAAYRHFICQRRRGR